MTVNWKPGLVLTVLLCAAGMSTESGHALENAEWVESSGMELREIITVFSRKREEAPYEIPISLTILSGKDLSEAGIEEVNELALFAPGFSFEKGFGRQLDRPVIRGMSTILSATQSEQNVGMYIDGIFVSGAISALTLSNLSRVEVMRGPQNALYGRSAFAGAVNYITRKPTTDLHGRLSITGAEHDEFRVNGFVSGPLLSDKLLFQAGAGYYTYGGEYNNTVTGKTIGGEESWDFSGALFWNASSVMDAVFRVSFSRDNDTHYPVTLQDSSFNNCFLATSDQYFCGEVGTFDSVALNTEEVGGGGMKRDTLRTNLTLNADLGFATLTSTTAYNDEELEAGLDQDFTGRQPVERVPSLKGLFQIRGEDTFEDISQELRLTSSDAGPVRWIGGFYFLYRKLGGEDFQPRMRPAPVSKTHNYAFFAQVQIDLSEDLTGTAEIRVARDEQSLLLADNRFLEADFDSVNPRFSLEYSRGENILFYVTISKGSKPGGFNTNLALPDNLRSFEEEKTWNYEIGVKGQSPDRRFTYTLAGFYIDWSSQQLTSSFDNMSGPPAIFIDNAGETEVKGFEASFRAEMTDYLTLEGGYAFTDASFVRFDVAEQAALTGDASVAGNQTPRSPKHMANISASFRQNLSPEIEGFFRTDLLFESKRFAQVHNFAHSGDKLLLNLRAGITKDRYSFSLWVKNVLDDRTAVSITRFRDFAGFDSFRAPRAFGVTLPRGRQVGASGRVHF